MNLLLGAHTRHVNFTSWTEFTSHTHRGTVVNVAITGHWRLRSFPHRDSATSGTLRAHDHEPPF